MRGIPVELVRRAPLVVRGTLRAEGDPQRGFPAQSAVWDGTRGEPVHRSVRCLSGTPAGAPRDRLPSVNCERLWSRLLPEAHAVAFDRISIDPNVCHGQACIKGTRIPVHQIVRMLANNDTVEDLLGEYPSLSREDVLACLDYAAALTEEQVTPIQIAGD